MAARRVDRRTGGPPSSVRMVKGEEEGESASLFALLLLFALARREEERVARGATIVIVFSVIIFQQVEMNCYLRKSPRSLAVLKRRAQRRMVDNEGDSGGLFMRQQ